jgi:hypothetical protein
MTYLIAIYIYRLFNIINFKTIFHHFNLLKIFFEIYIINFIIIYIIYHIFIYFFHISFNCFLSNLYFINFMIHKVDYFINYYS